MSEFENLNPEERAVWQFVAQSNDKALAAKFRGGSLEEAYEEIDRIRDEALEMAPDAKWQNEIECRRLEIRINAAFHDGSHQAMCDAIQDAGKSNRFSKDRLHFLLGVIGGQIRDLGRTRP